MKEEEVVESRRVGEEESTRRRGLLVVVVVFTVFGTESCWCPWTDREILLPAGCKAVSHFQLFLSSRG